MFTTQKLEIQQPRCLTYIEVNFTHEIYTTQNQATVGNSNASLIFREASTYRPSGNILFHNPRLKGEGYSLEPAAE